VIDEQSWVRRFLLPLLASTLAAALFTAVGLALVELAPAASETPPAAVSAP
jgi:hypothetical protein